jgi:hypothetical protein
MKVLRYIIICLFFLLPYPGSLSSDDGPKVLMINSDATVEKYEMAGNDFKKMMPHPVVEVSLDEKRWKISDVEDLIYDEDPELVYTIGTKAYLHDRYKSLSHCQRVCRQHRRGLFFHHQLDAPA